MVVHAAASGVPAWLAAALVGITAIGAIVNVVGSVLNAWLSLRRIEALGRQQEQRERERHAELLAAVREAKGPRTDIHLGG